MTKTFNSYPSKENKNKTKTKSKGSRSYLWGAARGIHGGIHGIDNSLFFKINGRFAGIKFYYYYVF